MLLKQVANRQIRYALASAIELGLLPPNEDFWKWDWVLPRSLSVDLGRDAKADLDKYREGLISLTDYCEAQGTTLEIYLRKKAYEYAAAEKIRQEISQETGIDVPAEAMPLLQDADQQSQS